VLVSPRLFSTERNAEPPSRAMIVQLRAITLSTMGVRAPGVPYDLAALALPPGADPALKAYEAPLLRWHREVWLLEQPHPAHPDALTATELTRAWHNTRKAMGGGMGWHIDTPVAGAIRAARLVGWDLDQPGRLTDGQGQLKLNERSPASLQTTYRRQWEEHMPQTWLRSKLQKPQPRQSERSSSGTALICNPSCRYSGPRGYQHSGQQKRGRCSNSSPGR
jgi:hypothetical protein